MINIYIDDKVIERHREYIKKSIIKKKIEGLLEGEWLIKLENVYGVEVLENHKAFVNCLLKEYENMDSGGNENIFVGKPEYLFGFLKKMEKEYSEVNELINKDADYSKRILDVFGYNNFVNSYGMNKGNVQGEEPYIIDNFEKKADDFKWGAYAYVLSLKLKVCPYCNRNYITPLYTEDGKMRADLDHFFAKSRYPYFSISLFNLVPSCKFCNSSLKGTEEFSFEENFHPFDEIVAENLYRITYIPKSVSCFWGEEELEIDIEYNYANESWKKINQNINTFKIKEIYQYHKDIVSNLTKKRYVYDEGYIDYLWKSYPNLFDSREEVVDFLVTSYNVSQIENVPLGKMIKDLIEEMWGEIIF